jgi:DNA-directed RNA polymerase alpha subunit
MSDKAPGGDLPQGLGKPAKRALAKAGIHDLDQLAGTTESELLGLHGMGQKALGQLRLALADRGKSLADDKRDG